MEQKVSSIDRSFGSRITVGLVVPVYAGEQFLSDLVNEIDRLRSRWNRDAAPVSLTQVLLVLDEPRDDSLMVATKVAAMFDWVEVITLSRNFGQHPATAAGVLHTSTDWVVTLDEDLQHPPEEIPAMLAKAIISRSDLAYACSQGPVHGGWRDLASRTAKHLVAKAAGLDSAIDFSSFRLIRGSIARAAASVAGHETYFDVALTWYTTRIIRHETLNPDTRGASSYRLRSLISHMRRLVISSNVKVLRGAAWLGLFGVVVAGVALTWFLASAVFGLGVPVQGWLSTITSVLLFGGILALATGLLSEYVLNIAQRVQGRPTFHTVDRSHDDSIVGWASKLLAESESPTEVPAPIS